MVTTEHAHHADRSLSLPRRRVGKVREANASNAWPTRWGRRGDRHTPQVRKEKRAEGSNIPDHPNTGQACRLCGQPLLIPIPGRDVCEMCRVVRRPLPTSDLETPSSTGGKTPDVDAEGEEKDDRRSDNEQDQQHHDLATHGLSVSRPGVRS